MVTKLRKVVLLFVAICPVAVVLLVNASSTEAAWPSCPTPTSLPLPGEARGPLEVRACGPSKVVRGTNYSYTVVVTNISRKSVTKLKVSVLHYEPISRSSIRYKREGAGLGSESAVWTVNKLKPLQTFRVSFVLRFEQHSDPKGSNFFVESRVRGANGTGGMTKDVYFIG